MQQDKDKDDDSRKDGEDSWKKKGIDDDDAAAADALDEDEAREDKITVPTKTEDGGSSNKTGANKKSQGNLKISSARPAEKICPGSFCLRRS